MNTKKRILCALVMLILCIGNTTVFAQNNIQYVLDDTAAYLCRTVSNPQVGSIGGEWAVMGLARSGYDVPEEYYHNYYKNVEQYVTACKGKLHDKKYTEYSRLIVALTAIGKNPADVAGYNLLTPLGDYKNTIRQGLNGPIWALIALDCGEYDVPICPGAQTQATRELYLQKILDCQLADGGWSLFGGTGAAASADGRSDPDITGMALQALAKYQHQPAVAEAIQKALDCMSLMQNQRGGFSSWDAENSESCVQALVALCELGIPLDDERFVKDGNTLLDNLLSFYRSGSGFLHTHTGEGSDLMATEQGFYGIVAADRLASGKNSLYRMSDAMKLSQAEQDQAISGLPGKNPNVGKTDIINPGKTFADISGHKNQPAIEALASRGVINGKSDTAFEPAGNMTRAEFAAIITRGLALSDKSGAGFADVPPHAWFYQCVNTAFSYGIVTGVSDTEFDPYGTITREQAAVMVARAASLCGADTHMELYEARDVLAVFPDYVRAADWAISSLGYCYGEGILDSSVMEIMPGQAVTRAEIAQMLFNMLSIVRLI